MTGILYVVATPIGNMEDITQRALRVLSEVNLVACEDTRRSQLLLMRFGLKKRLVRYDDHVHDRAVPLLLETLAKGDSLALLTDGGTPAISDPGGRLVKEVIKQGGKVIPIPGPSAPIAALSVSGFPSDGFVFLGFLPRRKGRALRLLQQALGLGRTVAVLESPFRVLETMNLIAELSPEADVVMAREMTKLHEEFLRGKAVDLQQILPSRSIKGEVTLLIRGVPEDD
jgi:16S rRNA (cytidine1402-2'-O)-methyltransferase